MSEISMTSYRIDESLGGWWIFDTSATTFLWRRLALLSVTRLTETSPIHSVYSCLSSLWLLAILPAYVPFWTPPFSQLALPDYLLTSLLQPCSSPQYLLILASLTDPYATLHLESGTIYLPNTGPRLWSEFPSEHCKFFVPLHISSLINGNLPPSTGFSFKTTVRYLLITSGINDALVKKLVPGV